jgi:hypothetical protein
VVRRHVFKAALGGYGGRGALSSRPYFNQYTEDAVPRRRRSVTGIHPAF